MKKTIIIIIILLINLNYSYAGLEAIDHSTEGLKTAEASVAKILGAANLYYNPAGIVALNNKELNVQYSRLLVSLDNDNLSYFNFLFGYRVKNRFKIIKLALAYNRFGSDLYAEQVVSLGAGFHLLKMGYKKIALGGRVKLLNISYNENDYTKIDPLFIDNGYSKSKLGIDLSLLAFSKQGFSYGLLLKNINTPNLSLENNSPHIPFQLNVGSAYKKLFKKPRWFMNEINYSLDLNYSKDYYRFLLGVEPYLFNSIFAPGLGFGMGNKNFLILTSGVSIKWIIPSSKENNPNPNKDKIFKFSYVFKYHLSGMSYGTYGDHYLSISLLFP